MSSIAGAGIEASDDTGSKVGEAIDRAPASSPTSSFGVARVTFGLIAIDCAIHALVFATWLGHGADPIVRHFGSMVPADLFHLSNRERSPPPELTLISYMFLHQSWVHLLGNMLLLYSVGPVVEVALGKTRFAILYVVSGIAAALVFALAHAHSHVQLIGASGAIAGVFGAALIAEPYVKVLFVVAGAPLRVPLLVLAPVWFGVEVLLSAVAWDDVAHVAHVGGFVVGTALFAVLRPAGVPLLRTPSGTAPAGPLTAASVASALGISWTPFIALAILTLFAIVTR